MDTTIIKDSSGVIRLRIHLTKYDEGGIYFDVLIKNPELLLQGNPAKIDIGVAEIGYYNPSTKEFIPFQ